MSGRTMIRSCSNTDGAEMKPITVIKQTILTGLLPASGCWRELLQSQLPFGSPRDVSRQKSKTFILNCLVRQFRIRETPQSRERDFSVYVRREGDWYLASGGMCQRNSCRVRNWLEGPFGRDYRICGEAAILPLHHCAKGYWF
jgi:hypothetical protein